jgi:Tol biopolymer transport system component
MVIVIAAAVLLIAAVVVGLSMRSRSVAHTEAVERRLTANPPEVPVTSSAISTDGRYLAYSDRTGVYVRQIDSGDTHMLSLPGTLLHPHVESWFPDGTHLVLSAWASSGEAQEILWVASILGGTPRKLVEDGAFARISPDGLHIAFLRGVAGVNEIWLVDNDGSNVHRLVGGATNKEYSFSPAAWSPDGTRLVYVRRKWLLWTSSEARIEILNLATTQTTTVFTDLHLGQSLLWRENDLIYTLSGAAMLTAGDVDLWRFSFSPDQLTVNSPGERISRGQGLILDLSGTADGKKLSFRRAEPRPNIYIAEVPAGSPTLLHPERISRENWADFVSAWTPDSENVLFASDRDGISHIFRQPIKVTPPELMVDGKNNVYLVRLTPSGTEILYVQSASPGGAPNVTRLMRLSLGGGTPQTVLEAPAIWNVECARTPSHVCLFSAGDIEHLKFFAFDPSNGSAHEILSGRLHITALPNWGLSPDGKYLALSIRESGKDASLRILSLSSSTEQTIPFPGWFDLSGVDWAADGRSLWVSACTKTQSLWGTPSTCSLMSVTTGGRITTVLEDRDVHFVAAIPSPNGKHLALIGENLNNSNVWLVALPH